jgi:hypothetical protein
MQSGSVEANLVRLNEEFRLPYLDELIARKVNGKEKGPLQDRDVAFYESEYHRLIALLEEAVHPAPCRRFQPPG